MHACASCGGHVSEVMDFGRVALAGAFLKEDGFAGELKYQLSLDFCESCFLLQVRERVPRETLFEDYFYFSSAIGTLRKHFAHYADEVVSRFKPDTVVEIGCNDGVMLRPLADLGVKRVIGVDPSNAVDGIKDARIEVVNDYFGPGLIEGKADVVIANNVIAHIEDINSTIKAVHDLLSCDGVFIFEVNRLDSMVADLQYDWVYHEHLFYYSLLALEKLLARHDLMIFDLKRIGTHAGSIRYYACHKGARDESPSVEDQRHKDYWHGLNTIDRFARFADDAASHRDRMKALVSDSLAQGQRIAGYGACGRANTMLQYCGFDASHIAYLVDDAPAKHGFFTPGSHIPIRPNAALADQPDMLIVFAWSFLSEIYDKCADFKGDMVIPLPELYKAKTRLAA